jgi:apolipoprotein N-acyltransferase
MKRAAPYLVSLIAGGVLSLAFPEPDVAPLAWVAIAPFLLVCRGVTAKRGFGLGYLFGVGFMGSLISWVSLVGWVAWALAVAIEAVFFGLLGAAWAVLSREQRAAVRVVGIAALWVALELARASVPFGGFTWGQLAQSQHNLAWMLRPAAFAGGWVVSAAIVAVNALLLESGTALVKGGHRRSGPAGALLPVGIAALLLLAPLGFPSAEAGGRELAVAIVQGNVPRDFNGPAFDKEEEIIASHERLTQELDAEVDLVVWPESSLGLDVDREEVAADAVASAARVAEAPMVVGGNLDIDADRYKVMAFEVDPTGAIVDRYQKTHLVPFGEYVPGRSILDALPMLDQVPRDAVAGDERTVFDVAGGKIAPVISFEGDFGSLVRRRIGEGGRLLIVATNTSTWGESWASAQHVAFSQVRAAENGVWVVHAALSGISAFIDPEGRIVKSTPLWTATSETQTVAFATEASFYARTGDWFAYLCSLVALSALLLGSRGRQRQ